jgi:hypothetical protein
VDSADIDKYINVITAQINVSTIQKIYPKFWQSSLFRKTSRKNGKKNSYIGDC